MIRNVKNYTKEGGEPNVSRLKKYLSSRCKDFKYLKREERKKIANEVIESGEFYNNSLHDLEDMLRIKTVDDDYPERLGVSLSPFYEDESLDEFKRKRQKTEKKILKRLYK